MLDYHTTLTVIYGPAYFGSTESSKSAVIRLTEKWYIPGENGQGYLFFENNCDDTPPGHDCENEEFELIELNFYKEKEIGDKFGINTAI